MHSRLYAYIGTFRQLELLLTVYETGSIKAAADRLHLAQPTVSMQLKKLSQAVDMPLYEQVGKRLIFTAAGERVVESARAVLGEIEKLDMDLSDLQGIKSGRLTLAVVTSSKYFAPHLMGAFNALYPGIDVQLKVGNREQIVERLEKELDDIYIFSHLPEEFETQNTQFLSNPLVAIAHKNNPLAKKNKVSLDELCRQDFISREYGSGTRYAIDNFLKRHHKSLNIKMTIESNEAIIHAVMSGLGVSILSAHALSFTASHSDIRKLNVTHMPIKTSWYLAWSTQKRLSLVAQEFLRFVQEEGKETINKVLRKNKFF